MSRFSTLGAMFATLGAVLASAGCTTRQENLAPFVAVAGEYSIMAADGDGDGGGVCKNCGGTGRVGDGRVFVPCPVCQPQATQKQQQTGVQPCLTGTCATRR